jgi:hypothetical protein
MSNMILNPFAHSVPELWTPAEITTSAWFDATVGVTDIGGAVSNWADQSGNGFNQTQSTEAAKPTTNSRTLGGLNALDFDGSGDFLSRDSGGGANPQPGSSDVMWFAAIDWDVTAAPYDTRVYCGYAGANTRAGGLFLTTTADGPLFLSDSGFSPANYGTHKYGAMIMCGYKSSGNQYAGWSGNYGPADGSAACPALDKWRIGAGPTGLNLFDGGIGEIILCLSHDTTTRQTLEGYLAWRWDGGVAGTLVGQLPGGHPYKSAPPYL